MTPTPQEEARAALDVAGSPPDTTDIATSARQRARLDAHGAEWRTPQEVLSDLASEAVDRAVADIGEVDAQRAALGRLLPKEGEAPVPEAAPSA